jgi:hypothetical protein
MSDHDELMGLLRQILASVERENAPALAQVRSISATPVQEYLREQDVTPLEDDGFDDLPPEPVHVGCSHGRQVMNSSKSIVCADCGFVLIPATGVTQGPDPSMTLPTEGR